MVLYYSFFLLFWWLMLCSPGGNHFLMFANFDRAQISGSVIIYNAQLHLITSSKILLSVKVMTNMQIYLDKNAFFREKKSTRRWRKSFEVGWCQRIMFNSVAITIQFSVTNHNEMPPHATDLKKIIHLAHCNRKSKTETIKSVAEINFHLRCYQQQPKTTFSVTTE